MCLIAFCFSQPVGTNLFLFLCPSWWWLLFTYDISVFFSSMAMVSCKCTWSNNCLFVFCWACRKIGFWIIVELIERFFFFPIAYRFLNSLFGSYITSKVLCFKSFMVVVPWSFLLLLSHLPSTFPSLTKSLFCCSSFWYI